MMDIISYRRKFHKIPELGFHEVKTTKEIIKILENLNCKLYYGRAIYEHGAMSDMSDIEKGFTGVMAEFGKAPYFLFRADIDGLKIEETKDACHLPNKFGFASTNDNMHACGHDGHIALALALCEHFSETGESVRVLFQPAEEGVGGSIRMADFIMEDVKGFLSFHIGLGEQKGYIGVGTSNFLATTKLDLTFHGKAAHAANSPEEGISALSMAIAFIDMTKDLAIDAHHKKFINIGIINGGGQRNAVMDKITLGMDLRSDSDEAMYEMLEALEKTAKCICEAKGETYELKIIARANAYKEENTKLVDAAIKKLNESGIKTHRMPSFGASEDVTRYLKVFKKKGLPALHIMLGTNLKGPHHSAEFDFDEEDLDFFYKAISLVYNEMKEEF